MSQTMSHDNHRDDDLLEMSRPELQEVIRKARNQNDKLLNATLIKRKRTPGKAERIRATVLALTRALYPPHDG